MKRRIPIRMQLLSMFGITIFLMLSVLSFLLFQYFQVGQNVSNIVTVTSTRNALIKDAHLDFTRALLSMRAFLMYGEDNFAQDYRKNIKEAHEKLQQYNAGSTQQDSTQEGAKLENLLTTYINDVGENAIAAKKTNASNLGQYLSQGKKLVAEIDVQFKNVDTVQSNYMTIKSDNLLKEIHSNTSMSIVASITIALFVLAVAFYFSRKMANRLYKMQGALSAVAALDLSQPDVNATQNDELGDMGKKIIEMKHSLRQMVGQLMHNADTLAAAGEEMSATVEEQLKAFNIVSSSVEQITQGSVHTADSINSISATIEQLSAGAEQMNSHAGNVSDSTQIAVSQADKGMEMLNEVVMQQEQSANAMQEITHCTSVLVQGSQDIRGIVNVIQGIAGQTNLLALNAAIEAARAGEAGRGFAVVAEEVRKLAEQSADATKNIEEIIHNMGNEIDYTMKTVTTANDEVAKGKETVGHTKQQFEDIIQKLDATKIGIGRIAQAISESANGTQAMAANVQNISAVAEETSSSTQSVAASVQEQSASMQEINSQADSLAQMAAELHQIIQKFKM